MKQSTIQHQDTENSGKSYDDRHRELASQKWNRSKSSELAKREGFILNDEHWVALVFLRQFYLMHGLPNTARITSKALNKYFIHRGGSKYLHQLFRGGPVTQGSRLANLRTPAYSTDLSFGTNY